MPTFIPLEFPELLPIPETFSKLQEMNPKLDLKLNQRQLIISEKDFSFSDRAFFSLYLPFSMDEESTNQLCELNQDIKLEWDEEVIIINMSTIGFIGVFTAAIVGTLYIWNKLMKMGRIVESSTGHDLETNGKKKHRVPDIGFHLNQSFADKIHSKTYKLGAPYFCIEIVSNKNSLKQELQKMKDDWIQGGVEIGLVVCPFREEYFLFESNQTNYKSFSFSHIFTHPSLPDLQLDFKAILEEATS